MLTGSGRTALRTCAFLFLVPLVTASPILAAPVVNSIAGDLTHGSAITIAGSGFGVKTQASPFKYDDFESGVLGQRVQNGWYTSSSTTGCWPIYSDAHSRFAGSAERSAYIQHDKAYNSTLGVTGLNWGYGREAYISCWYYCTTTGAGSRNFKILAFRGGGAGNWDGPDFRADMYPVNGGGHAYVARPDKSLIVDDWSLGGNLQTDGWRRIELYMHTGTAGGGDSDGICLGWRNLSPWWSLTNFEFDFSTQDYDNIYFAAYFARDQGTPTPCMWWYWDEIYIDTTRARVEIGDASTWSACTHREVQIPSAWASNSVTVTLNQGSLDQFEGKYLYVVDSTGAINASGRLLGDQTYTLTVTNGSGSGEYDEAELIAISADPAPTGKLFAWWIGDYEHVADRMEPLTTVTMPAADISVTATYAWAYELTVNSGTGDGLYLYGTVVDVQADPSPTNMTFAEWTGDTGQVADPLAEATTITMPTHNCELTATYETALAGDLDGDGFVGQSDLDIILAGWGDSPPADPRADPSGDNMVGQADLDIVLDDWGAGG